MSSRVRLDLFDNKKGFNRGASKLKEGCWYLIKIFFFLGAFPYPSSFKIFLLKLFGARVGEGVVLKPRVNIHFPWKLSVGDHVWIGEEVFILNFEKVTIGSNVCLSQRVFLCAGNHDFRDPSFSYRNGPIELEDGCWVGANSFVGPNARIGVDTVVSAGSVVTSSLPPNGIYKGNPLTYISDRWK